MGPISEMLWAIEYKDGSIVSQIDPVARIENRYSIVNHKRAVRYWWLPVPPGLNMPGFRYNPKLHKHGVESKGAMGFVTRRTTIEVTMGKRTETPEEKLHRIVMHPPMRVACYVVGIDDGPRVEIYPDGSVIELKEPRSKGEVQGALK